MSFKGNFWSDAHFHRHLVCFDTWTVVTKTYVNGNEDTDTCCRQTNCPTYLSATREGKRWHSCDRVFRGLTVFLWYKALFFLGGGGFERGLHHQPPATSQTQHTKHNTEPHQAEPNRSTPRQATPTQASSKQAMPPGKNNTKRLR